MVEDPELCVLPERGEEEEDGGGTEDDGSNEQDVVPEGGDRLDDLGRGVEGRHGCEGDRRKGGRAGCGRRGEGDAALKTLSDRIRGTSTVSKRIPPHPPPPFSPVHSTRETCAPGLGIVHSALP